MPTAPDDRQVRWDAFLTICEPRNPLGVANLRACKPPIQAALCGEWPLAGQLEDGQIGVTWGERKLREQVDSLDVYIELEIGRDGRISWFCKNLTTGEHAGEEEDVPDVAAYPFDVAPVLAWIAKNTASDMPHKPGVEDATRS